MKRIGGLFDRVHEASTLARAVWLAARGKRDRGAVREFLAHGSENLNRISQQLRTETFCFDPYTSFAIRDPKTRIIHAPSFRDRVVHHAIVTVSGPIFELGAVDHSYACRKGKGQHPALQRAARMTRHDEAFLKLDVAKYYDSVEHDLLRLALTRRFRERRFLRLMDSLLDSYSTHPGKGLPIGALTSQYLGNFYLDSFDHWAQQHHGGRRYLRYMDDMLFFGTLSALRGLRGEAEQRLALLGLRIKNGGVLNRCSLGVPWLGFTLYPNRVRLNGQGRKRFRRRIRALDCRRRSGLLDERILQARGEALIAHARQGSNPAWRRAMLGCAPIGEALELDEARRSRWVLGEFSQELPLRDPQQEVAREPQQEPGLPCLSAPRHGGAATPPDVTLSRAPFVTSDGDESSGRSPVEAEISTPTGKREKAVTGEPPLERRDT